MSPPIPLEGVGIKEEPTAHLEMGNWAPRVTPALAMLSPTDIILQEPSTVSGLGRG